MTLVTTKCFSRLRGFNAVHFASKSFFGRSGFFRALEPGVVSTTPGSGVVFIDGDDAACVKPRAAIRQTADFHPAHLRFGQRLLDAGHLECHSRTWRTAPAANRLWETSAAQMLLRQREVRRSFSQRSSAALVWKSQRFTERAAPGARLLSSANTDSFES